VISYSTSTLLTAIMYTSSYHRLQSAHARIESQAKFKQATCEQASELTLNRL